MLSVLLRMSLTALHFHVQKVDEAMRSLYTRDKGTHKESIRNNLVIIGPFTDDAKATTGTP